MTLSHRPLRPLPLALIVLSLAALVSDAWALQLVGSCATLSGSDTYQLISDPTVSSGTCFIISSASTLDCAGHYIRSSTPGSFIGASISANGGAVKNCRFYNLSTDVVVSGVTGASVSNSTLGTAVGLAVNNTNHSRFDNLSFSNISVYGIWVTNSSSRNNFTGISISTTGSGSGIQVDAGSQNNTFDAQGGLLNGSEGASTYGLHDQGGGTVLKNAVVRRFTHAVWIDGASRSTVANVTMNTTQSSGFAIRLSSSASQFIVDNSTIGTNGTEGICLRAFSSSNATFSRTSCITTGDGAAGVLAEGSPNITVRLSSFNASTGSAHLVQAYDSGDTGWLIENNTLNSSGSIRGIYYGVGSGGGNSVIRSNTIRTGGNAIRVGAGAYSLSIYNNSMISASTGPLVIEQATNISIENNTIQGEAGGYGIHLQGSVPDGVRIAGNFINHTGPAIRSDAGNNVNVSGNTIRVTGTASHGIDLASSSANWTIQGNNINTTAAGIFSVFIEASTVTNVSITDNFLRTTAANGVAVNITGGDGMMVASNNMTSGGTCLYIDSTSENNTVHLNNFLSCSPVIHSLGAGNAFNTTLNGTARGNSYANITSYAILDSDQDGFGDTGSKYPANATNTPGLFAAGSLGADWGPAGANTTIVSISACANLTQAGYTYRLTANAAYSGTCFNITAANVTLDGQGFSISGTNGTAVYGVYSNQLNSTVKNLVVSNFTHGVYLSGSVSSLVQNVTARTTKASSFGILLDSGSNSSRISSSSAYSLAASGLGILNSYNVSVSGTLANTSAAATSFAAFNITGSDSASLLNISAALSPSNVRAVLIGLSHNGQLRNSVLNTTGSSSAAVVFQGTAQNWTVAGNALSTFGSSSSGIYSSPSSPNVGNLTLANNTVLANTSSRGIDFTLVSDSVLYNNTVQSRSDAGIFLASGRNNSILSNPVNTTSYRAVWLSNCLDHLISGNDLRTLSGSQTHFYFSLCNSTRILNNTMNSSAGTNAFYSDGGLDVAFINNTLATTNSSGTAFILASNAQRWNISGNRIFANSSSARGIDLSASTLYDLNFTDNYVQTALSQALFVSTAHDLWLENNTFNTTGSSGTVQIQSLLNPTNIRLFGNTVQHTTGVGITVSDATNNSLLNNRVFGTSGRCIFLNTDANGSTISGNTLTSTGSSAHAIQSSTNSNLTIRNNTILTSGASAYGVLLTATSINNLVADNTISTSGSSGGFGLYIDNADSINNVFSGNLINNTGVSGVGIGLCPTGLNTIANNTISTNSSSAYGIWLCPASNVTVLNNTVSTSGSSSYAIYIQSSTLNNTVQSNTLLTTGATAHGIYASGPTNLSTFAGNTINVTHGASVGILLTSSARNTVANNTIAAHAVINGSATSYAISLVSSSNNTLSNNTCTFSRICFAFSASWNNTLLNNTANTTTGDGLFITSTSSRNLLSGNSFTITGPARSALFSNGGNQNTFENSTVFVNGSGSFGVYLSASSVGWSITNNAITTQSKNIPGIWLAASTSNTTSIILNTISVQANSSAINLTSSSRNNITNNTLSSASKPTLSLSSSSNFNLAYHNNFTAGTYSINDSGTSNQFNTTINGTAQGNFYPDLSPYDIYDQNGDGFGDSGGQYPAGGTNTPGLFAPGSVGSDWGPYRASTPNLTACRPLSVANTTFLLNQDVSGLSYTCFNITAANVTLDCQGHSITGTGALSSYGVYANWTGATVKNCRIQNFSSEILLSRASNSTLLNNTLSHGINPTANFSWLDRSGSGAKTVWYPIASSADGSRIVAAAQSDYIYTSADGGLTWSQRTGAGNRTWNSVASSGDGTRLFGAAYGDYIYGSNDSGATWAPLTGSGARNWYTVFSAPDGAHLAAVVVGGGYIYTSDDSGVTWTQQTAAGARNWYAITMSDDGTHLAANVYGGNIYVSNDSGASWAARASAQNWYYIAGSADGTYLISGVDVGGLYTSNDSGVTWTQQTAAGSRKWYGVASSDDGARMAAVVRAGVLYASTNYGVNWTAQPVSAGTWYLIASSRDGTRLAATRASSDIFTGQAFTRSIHLNLTSNVSLSLNSISTSVASSVGIDLVGSNQSQIFNNSLGVNASSGWGLSFDSGSSNNFVYHNNFTSAAAFINASGASNHFNTTINGTARGNSYANITSYAVLDSDGDGFGDSGAQYPANATNTPGLFAPGSVGADWGPAGATLTALSACANLSLPDVSYTLVSDISGISSTCFNITASNVTLDGQGHSISGTNASGTAGVNATASRAAVRNLLISGFQHGVRLSGSNNATLDNLTINVSFASGVGIYLPGANTTLINRTTINTTAASAYGIYSDGSAGAHDLTVAGSALSTSQASAHAIYAPSNSDRWSILNNTLSVWGNAYGIYLETDGHIISANTVNASGSSAIALYLNGAGSRVENNSFYGPASNYAVRTSASESNFTNNTLWGESGVALYAPGATANRFASLTLRAGTGGIGLYLGSGASANTLSGSTISATTGVGVYSQSSGPNNLTANSISATTGSAVKLHSSTGYFISGNTLNTTTGSALYLTSSSDSNTLSNNLLNATGSGGVGILSDAGDSNSAVNNSIATNGSSGYGISLSASSEGWTLANNSITTSGAAAHGIRLSSSTVRSANLVGNTVRILNSGDGILINLSSNHTVHNNTLLIDSGLGPGVEILASSNNTLSNNTFAGTSGSAAFITLSHGVSNAIRSNAMYLPGNGDYALYLMDSNRTEVSGNNITTQNDGSVVTAYYSNDLSLENNTVATEQANIGSGYSMVVITDSLNPLLRNNTLSSVDSGGTALEMARVQNTLIAQNTISAPGYSAMSITWGQNTTVLNNTLNAQINFGLSNNSYVLSNTVSGPTPLSIGSGRHGLVANNTLSASSGGSGGIYLPTFGVNLTVYNNNVVSFGSDDPTFWATGLNDSNISSNTFNATGPSSHGIKLTSSSNNLFSNNTVFANTTSGTGFISDSGSGGNLIYWNNFTGGKFAFNLSSAANHLNTTLNGSAQGNFYPNTTSYRVYDTNADGFADLGSHRPFNVTNAIGLFAPGSLGSDWGPALALSTQLSACANLSETGLNYTLVANLSTAGTCFNVVAENVTIDCRGFSITGANASDTYGVFSRSAGTTVRGCLISDFGSGLQFYSTSSRGLVENNTVSTSYNTSCSYSSNNCHALIIYADSGSHVVRNNSLVSRQYALVVHSSADVWVANNTVNATSGPYALYLSASPRANVTNNTLSSGGAAVFMDSVLFSNLSSNRITSAGSNGFGVNIQSNAYNNTFESNVLSSSGDFGYAFNVGSPNNTFASNLVTTSGSSGRGIHLATGAYSNSMSANNISTSGSGAYAIYVTSPNNTLAGNLLNTSASSTYALYLSGTAAYGNNATANTILTSSSSAHAVRLDTASGNRLSANNLTTTGSGAYAVYLNSQSSSNTVWDNNLSTNNSNSFAVQVLSGSNGNNLSSNRIATSGSFGYGISLSNANATSVFNNTLNASATIGIKLASAWSSNLTNNTLSSSSYGLDIDSASSDNLIYHNTFLAASAFINSNGASNHFNTTLNGTAQGNSYANITSYALYDSDGDGFGDSGARYPANATNTPGLFAAGSVGADWGPRSATSTALSACANLSLAGVSYTLVSDISGISATCINITAANVTLDGRGRSLSGSNSSSSVGINATAFNATVFNLSISGMRWGLLVSGSSNSTFRNLTLNSTYSGGAAINLSGSSNSTLIRSVVISTDATSVMGVYSQGSANTALADSRIRAAGASSFALALASSSSGWNITNNTLNVTQSSGRGISLSGSGSGNATVSSNTINSSGNPLWLSTSSNNLFELNDISTNGDEAVLVQSSSNSNRFINNTISGLFGASEALYLQSSSNNLVANNTITTAATNAVILQASSSNNITSNTLRPGSSGLMLTTSPSSNRIVGNSINSSGSNAPGIDADSGASNLFANNTILTSGSSSHGLRISSSSVGSTISGNNISSRGPSAHGIYLAASSVNNSLVHLNIVNASGSQAAAILLAGAANNNLTNNTLWANLTSGTGLSMDSSSRINQAYWNTFLSAAALVNNSNATNQLNTTINGSAQGNSYPNITSYAIYDSNADGWAEGGADYPVNATNAPGLFAPGSVGADWGPATSKLNTAPVITAIALIPASPSISSTLVCDVTSTDAQQTSLTLHYSWYRNGTSQPSLSGTLPVSNATGYLFNLTLNTSIASKGDVWACAAYANDTLLPSALNLSNNVTIANSAPAIAANLSFSNASAGHWLWANATASDPDGGADIVSALASASLGSCAPVSNATSGANFTARFNCSGTPLQPVVVNATFNDSSGAAASTWGTTAYPNRAPNTTAPSLSPVPIYKSTANVSCANATGYDPDGDNVTFYYAWYLNNTSAGVWTQNITNVSFSKGDSLLCEATPSDTYQNGTPLNSTSVTVINSWPTITNISLSNQSMNSNSTCRAYVLDGDGPSDLVGVNFTLVAPNGTVLVSNATGVNLGGDLYRSPYLNLSSAGVWNCSVTAQDRSNATTTLDAQFTVVLEWQRYYGSTSGQLQLGSGVSQFILNWSTTHAQGVFVAEPTVAINFTYLYPLGVCPNGTNHTGSGINDFSAADSALSLGSADRRIRDLFDADNNSVADSPFRMSIFGRNVSGIPSAKIEPDSPFSTGILWQGSSNQPTVCYNGLQDLVFAVTINKSATPIYGSGDYELMLPPQLASYRNSSNRYVAFYGEYTG